MKESGLLERESNNLHDQPQRSKNRDFSKESVLSSPPRVSANLAAGMLENNRLKRPRSLLDGFVSVALHAAVLAAALLIPLMFTHALDLKYFQTTYLLAPPPPSPPPPPATVTFVHPRVIQSLGKFYAPRVVPKKIVIVKDQQNASQAATTGVIGGVVGGVPGGVLGGVLGGILGETRTAPPPPSAPKPVAHRGPYRVGGLVQAPRLLSKIEPMYPPLAREARISGTVVIDCVIDANGDVTQLKLVSGHPLLLQAAFAAVKQWKYSPTLLNGKPVPVEMHVYVTFQLGS